MQDAGYLILDAGCWIKKKTGIMEKWNIIVWHVPLGRAKGIDPYHEIRKKINIQHGMLNVQGKETKDTR